MCAADLARAGIEVSRAPPTVSAPPGSGSWWPFGGKTGELNKALIEAAQAGHVANVEALLDKGADINAGDHVRVRARASHVLAVGFVARASMFESLPCMYDNVIVHSG